MTSMRLIRTLRYWKTVSRPSARRSGGGDLNGLESICTSIKLDTWPMRIAVSGTREGLKVEESTATGWLGI